MAVGEVLIADGGKHLVMCSDMSLRYEEAPEADAYCPSVDVFFNSVVDHWSGDLEGVLLTGMGRDGAKGLLRLRNSGAHTIAQDEKSCAVYGMPKAAAQLNAATQILSIEEIGPTLINCFSRKAAGRKAL